MGMRIALTAPCGNRLASPRQIDPMAQFPGSPMHGVQRPGSNAATGIDLTTNTHMVSAHPDPGISIFI